MVRQYRVFAPEVVPIAVLNSGPGSDVFQRHFSFKDIVTPDPNTPEVYFVGGMVDLGDDSVPITINYVQINPQRVILEAVGTSEAADIAFAAMAGALAGYDPDHRIAFTAPLLLTQETQCSVVLKLDWTNLISDQLRQFVTGEVPARVSTNSAKARIGSMNLRFTIRFDALDERLADYSVVHADKELILEPRQNTPLSARTFFTQSPLDSISHLKLVEVFERSMGGPAARKRLKQ